MKLAPVAAQKSECAIGTCSNWTIGPRFRRLRTFDLAPPSGRVALDGRFPGLKPWAEFCSPFGAQNKNLSPRIVAYNRFHIGPLDLSPKCAKMRKSRVGCGMWGNARRTEEPRWVGVRIQTSITAAKIGDRSNVCDSCLSQGLTEAGPRWARDKLFRP